jgi:glycosyltransferase involved in cell wall biosynthesis
MKGRIAWAMVPHLGGIASVYKTLSAGLRAKGWEVLPVWAGELPSLHGSDDLRESVEILNPESSDVRDCACELVRWVTRERIDILVRIGEPFVLAGLPAFPPAVRVVAKCPNQSQHSYRLVTACPDWTDLILVETQRQYEDLTKTWHAPESKCALIMNGVNVDTFRPPVAGDFGGRLRLVYTGRLDEATKHVMLLPDIGRVLARDGVPFQMKIVGDGPDRTRLEKKIHALGLAGGIQLLGAVPREDLPRFLQEAQVAILPSRLDGMSWVFLESMACGCVPVVSRLHQTTDMVVEDGLNGFLCRVSDAKAFASAITILANDRARLQSMSLAARKTIEERFTVDRMVDAHDRAFTELLNRPQSHPAPVSLSEIQAPRTEGSSWRAYVPRPVKNAARTWAERFGRTL